MAVVFRASTFPTPAAFVTFAQVLAAQCRGDGAVCEVCGERPEGDEFAVVAIDGQETWTCDSCAALHGDCGLCDAPHGGRSCPVDR